MPFEAVLIRQLAVLKDELTAAAARDSAPLTAQVAELTAARDRFRARAEELAAANEALSLELEARAAEREAAGEAAAALEAEREHTSRLATQLAALETRHADLQRTHASLTDSVTELRRAADAHRAELASAHAALSEAAAARDREATARDALEGEAARLRAQLSSIRADYDAEAARIRGDSAAALAAAEAETVHLRAELALARAAHRDRLAARLALLFEEIGRGASTDEILSAAANGLADDFSRVAVFAAVSGGRLEARYQRGFDQASGIERVVPVLGDGSMLARAAASSELVLHYVDALTDLPVSGAPSLVVTAPVAVQGELVALLYADDDGQAAAADEGATVSRIADLVRRHTALRLELLTQELKTIGELRSYAKMLLDEVEYVYRADVSARKPEAERLERLTENLRCARQFYLQRVAVEGPSMARLIEEVISAAIAARSATPFGRELAGVSAHAHPSLSEVGG